MLGCLGRKLSVPALAILLPLLVTEFVAAQTATPAAYPVAPDPRECIIDPATVEEIGVILGTPVAEPAFSATPFVRPAG